MSAIRKLHARFETALPRILRHARCFFRWIKCYHTKEDKLQEVRSLCWKWVKELHRARKKWWLFVSRLADYACRAVKSGHRVAGMILAKDVFNEITQTRKCFYVGKLPDFSTESSNPLAEALTDHSHADVADHVAFKIDFPVWRCLYDDRRRRILDTLALGHRTKDVAEKFRMSGGRISQMRREFMRDWKSFTGDTPAEVN
jgi:hypothetical protein